MEEFKDVLLERTDGLALPTGVLLLLGATGVPPPLRGGGSVVNEPNDDLLERFEGDTIPLLGV